MSYQEQVFDRIGYQKVPDPVIVRQIILDFFSQDQIVEGIELYKIFLIFKGPVNALVVLYPFFKCLNRFFSFQVFEFRELYLP